MVRKTSILGKPARIEGIEISTLMSSDPMVLREIAALEILSWEHEPTNIEVDKRVKRLEGEILAIDPIIRAIRFTWSSQIPNRKNIDTMTHFCYHHSLNHVDFHLYHFWLEMILIL